MAPLKTSKVATYLPNDTNAYRDACVFSPVGLIQWECASPVQWVLLAETNIFRTVCVFLCIQRCESWLCFRPTKGTRSNVLSVFWSYTHVLQPRRTSFCANLFATAGREVNTRNFSVLGYVELLKCSILPQSPADIYSVSNG